MQTKARRSTTPPDEDSPDSLGKRQHALLEKQYHESVAAFSKWETAQAGTDKQLYQAIGRLAEFSAAVGNDQHALAEFAAGKGVRTNKASSTYAVIAKLVVTTDRRKASKYAAVLHLAARQGVEPRADAIVTFIQAEGGIEACLRHSREIARDGGPSTRRGRPTAFSQAVEHMSKLGRSQAPEGLRLDQLLQDYVLIVGVRGEDGTLQLLHEPVTEESLVRKAIGTLRPKG